MNATTLRASIESLSPRKPLRVDVNDKVRKVVEIMKDSRFGCVLVTENDKLVGIVTERDILRKVLGNGFGLDETRVRDIMTREPEYLFQDDDVAFAINRMHVGGFRHIPLVDLQGKPTGIISVRDILHYLVENIRA